MAFTEKKEGAQLPNDRYAGINPVREALRAGVLFDTVYVSEQGGRLAPLIAECRKAGATVKQVPPAKLDALAGGAGSQGIVAVASSAEPATLEDIFAAAEAAGQPPLILIADGIEDPHNLGALIRSAECAGAHGLIVPRHRSAVIGGIVSKSSAGAVAYLPVVKTVNLVSAMQALKERGVWIYGADMDGSPYDATDYTGPTALVIGSEGRGLGRLVRDNCDGLVCIPMFGHVNSLNASVAGGILLFEAAGQRRKQNN